MSQKLDKVRLDKGSRNSDASKKRRKTLKAIKKGYHTKAKLQEGIKYDKGSF